MVGFGVAMLADTPIIVNIGAVVLVFRDDIHHTGDGVGPVDSTAAIVQDLNAIDRRQRN